MWKTGNWRKETRGLLSLAGPLIVNNLAVPVSFFGVKSYSLFAGVQDALIPVEMGAEIAEHIRESEFHAVDGMGGLVMAMYGGPNKFFELVWEGGALSRPQVELLAARVSAVNECFY